MGIERAIGRIIINSLIPQGLGSNAIIRALIERGASYRRTDMLSDIREAGGLMRYEASIRDLSPGTVVPKSWMTELELKAPYQYRVFGEAQMIDMNTGEAVTKRVSFYTDQLSSVGAWEDDFIEAFEGAYGEENTGIVSLKVAGVQHNAGYEY